MSAKVGHKCKLYRNTGTFNSSTWVEITQVGDVNIPDLNMGMAELKTRASNWTKNLATLLQSVTIEFNMIHGVDAANFNALRENFFSATPQEFAIMDGSISTNGSQGLRIPAFIQAFPWSQPLEEVSDHALQLVTAYYEESGNLIDPTWYVVGA